MPLSTIFQLYHGVQFHWWITSEYREKTTVQHRVQDEHKQNFSMCMLFNYSNCFLLCNRLRILDTTSIWYYFTVHWSWCQYIRLQITFVCTVSTYQFVRTFPNSNMKQVITISLHTCTHNRSLF
jgi:hypothetical protein